MKFVHLFQNIAILNSSYFALDLRILEGAYTGPWLGERIHSRS